MECLFTLRNILAHGTAIIQPVATMEDGEADKALFAWQKTLQQTRVYLKKLYGHEEVFDNLAEYSVPEHFLAQSQLALKGVLALLPVTPERCAKVIDVFLGHSFGYTNFG